MKNTNKTIILADIFSIIIIILVISIIISLLFYTQNDTFYKIIESKEILHSLKLSIIISVSAVILGFVFGLPISYILARYNFKFRNIIDILLNIPIFLPPMFLGIVFLIILNKFNFINIVYTPLGIFIIQFFIALPFMIKTFKNGFESLSGDYSFVAQTLGHTKIKSIIKVEIPIIKRSIFTGLLLGWCRAIGDFGGSLIIGGAINNYTQTLPISIYLKLSVGEVDVAVILTLLMIVFVSIIFLILKKIKI